MTTTKHTLAKSERLSWKRYIDTLFANGHTFVAYPWRVVYLYTDETMPARTNMLVSVSKKKFKRAVKRNRIKRQLRESYRLHKQELIAPLEEANKHLLLAFIYLDKEEHTFKEMEKAINKTVRLLKERLSS